MSVLLAHVTSLLPERGDITYQIWTLSELLTKLSADQLQEVMLEAMAAARSGNADWRMTSVAQADEAQEQVMFSIEHVQNQVWRLKVEG